MVVRELPKAEWGRVAHLEIGYYLSLVPDADVVVVVAEHRDRIVAAWCALRMAHLEGAWVDPAYRRHAHMVNELRERTVAAAHRWGRWALTGANTPEVAHLVEDHLGGRKVDMDTYVIDLEAQAASCR